jgi:hypothetical protein
MPLSKLTTAICCLPHANADLAGRKAAAAEAAADALAGVVKEMGGGGTVAVAMGVAVEPLEEEA